MSPNFFKFFFCTFLRACLLGGRGPQVGEVTCGDGSTHLSCKRDQIKMRDYITDRRATSSTSGPLPPCKQAAKFLCIRRMINVS